MKNVNLGDFINFWLNSGKLIRYYIVAEKFKNINYAEDLKSAEEAMENK